LTVLEEVDGGEERAHDGVGERGAPSDEVEARLLMDAEYAPHCLVESRWNRKRRLPLRSKQLLFACTARSLLTEDFGLPPDGRESLSQHPTRTPASAHRCRVAAHSHRSRSHSPVNKGGGALFWLTGESLDLSLPLSVLPELIRCKSEQFPLKSISHQLPPLVFRHDGAGTDEEEAPCM
jgi:hypothetical protein